MSEFSEDDCVVILEWSYSPPAFFEELVTIKTDDYEITIDDGAIEVRVGPDRYQDGHKVRNELQQRLSARFQSAQLVSHQRYELAYKTMYRLHPDGRRDDNILVDFIESTSTIYEPEFSLL